MKFSSKKKCLFYAFALFLSFLFATNFCLAAFLKDDTIDAIDDQTFTAGEGSYEISDSGDIYNLIQTVINAFLAIAGVLLLTYMLYAGYYWMTARGEEEKVEKAKETIQYAVVGMIIIVAAYAISVFVMARLEAGTLKGGGGVYNYQAPPTP